jgi:hypothetical protein
VQQTLRRFHEIIVALEKQKVLQISVCARACVRSGAQVRGVCMRLALLIRHATRVRHIVTSFVVPLAAPHFSALSQKRHDFRKQVVDNKMCVFIFSTNFV